MVATINMGKGTRLVIQMKARERIRSNGSVRKASWSEHSYYVIDGDDYEAIRIIREKVK